jgi:hypothetical protein
MWHDDAVEDLAGQVRQLDQDQVSKSFLLLFFKKEGLSSLL